mmetsp:Transcript_43941/g.56328  ORF Transcript_43941/g.56328 Transcript_43941/m.56328 type:complete len:350 (+) Transcript_43941:1739-2788(+)
MSSQIVFGAVGKPASNSVGCHLPSHIAFSAVLISITSESRVSAVVASRNSPPPNNDSSSSSSSSTTTDNMNNDEIKDTNEKEINLLNKIAELELTISKLQNQNQNNGTTDDEELISKQNSTSSITKSTTKSGEEEEKEEGQSSMKPQSSDLSIQGTVLSTNQNQGSGPNNGARHENGVISFNTMTSTPSTTANTDIDDFPQNIDGDKEPRSSQGSIGEAALNVQSPPSRDDKDFSKIPQNFNKEELAFLIRVYDQKEVHGLNISSFHKAVTDCMLKSPGTEFTMGDVPRIKDMDKAFHKADADNSGVVDFNEFIDLYSKIKKGEVDGLAGYGFFEKRKKKKKNAVQPSN